MSGFGSRIGQVDDDSIEITEGRMRIEVDSRRPLKFKRKVESPDAENVTIEIKYDMLFKHCTTCGLMSHEKGCCPTMEATPRGQRERGGVRLPSEQGGARAQAERGGVFARVQLPQDHKGLQPLLRYRETYSRRQHEKYGTNVVTSRWADT